MQEHWISLQQASRVSGRDREELHRLILMGELASIPVDDDRLYLVRMEDVEPALREPPVAAAPERTGRVRVWPYVLFVVFGVAFGVGMLHPGPLVDGRACGWKHRQTQSTFIHLISEIEEYRGKRGHYPGTLDVHSDFHVRPKYLHDGFGKRIRYRLFSDHSGFELISTGGGRTYRVRHFGP